MSSRGGCGGTSGRDRGSVVGVAGVYFGWLSSRGQRRHAERLAAGQHDHERRIARGERLFDLRAEAYEELDGHLQRVMLVLERTHPIMGPTPPPPPSPSDDEWLAMRAKVGRVAAEEKARGSRVELDHVEAGGCDDGDEEGDCAGDDRAGEHAPEVEEARRIGGGAVVVTSRSR